MFTVLCTLFVANDEEINIYYSSSGSFSIFTPNRQTRRKRCTNQNLFVHSMISGLLIPGIWLDIKFLAGYPVSARKCVQISGRIFVQILYKASVRYLAGYLSVCHVSTWMSNSVSGILEYPS